MRTTVEVYKGFEIEFDTDLERFLCVASEDDTKESKSFAAVKRFVDKYVKENDSFVSFWVEAIPDDLWAKEKMKIIGLRSDGKPIGETSDNEKKIISTYDLGHYMMQDSENEDILTQMHNKKQQFEDVRSQYREERKELISKLKIKTLKDFIKENFSK